MIGLPAKHYDVVSLFLANMCCLDLLDLFEKQRFRGRKRKKGNNTFQFNFEKINNKIINYYRIYLLFDFKACFVFCHCNQAAYHLTSFIGFLDSET